MAPLVPGLGPVTPRSSDRRRQRSHSRGKPWNSARFRAPRTRTTTASPSLAIASRRKHAWLQLVARRLLVGRRAGALVKTAASRRNQRSAAVRSKRRLRRVGGEAPVPAFRPVVSSPPPSEPDVRVPPHPALHEHTEWFRFMPAPVGRARATAARGGRRVGRAGHSDQRSAGWSTDWGSAHLGSGSG
jgi:hypothetical protein